jgi:hypothetical protein
VAWARNHATSNPSIIPMEIMISTTWPPLPYRRCGKWATRNVGKFRIKGSEPKYRRASVPSSGLQANCSARTGSLAQILVTCSRRPRPASDASKAQAPALQRRSPSPERMARGSPDHSVVSREPRWLVVGRRRLQSSEPEVARSRPLLATERSTHRARLPGRTLHLAPGFAAHLPQTPAQHRLSPDATGHTRTAPASVSAGEGPFSRGVAGEGFEPSLSRRISDHCQPGLDLRRSRGPLSCVRA